MCVKRQQLELVFVTLVIRVTASQIAEILISQITTNMRCIQINYKQAPKRDTRAVFTAGSWTFFFLWSFFHLFHMCCNDIWVSPKIKSFLFILNSRLPKFRHGKSIALSTKIVVVVVDGRVCRRHLYDSRRVVAVYYKSVNCNLWLHRPTSICCGFVVQLISAVDEILTDVTRRAVRLRWQSFLWAELL